MVLIYCLIMSLYLGLCLYSVWLILRTTLSVIKDGFTPPVRKHLIAHIVWISLIGLLSWSFLILQMLTYLVGGRELMFQVQFEYFVAFNTLILGFLYIVLNHFKSESDSANPCWIGEK